jgi:hypothetical protein
MGAAAVSTYAEAAYGTGNLGDDAILAGLRASISPQTIAVSYHPAIVEQPAIHHDELTEHIKPGDTFIVGGGGLFFAPGNVTALRDRALDLKGRGARIEVRGLGTEGPGEQAVDSARALVAAASCAEVRSRRSMAFLARIGVSGARYAPDLAHALLRPAPRPRRNVVGFVSSVPDGDDGALEQVGARPCGGGFRRRTPGTCPACGLCRHQRPTHGGAATGGPRAAGAVRVSVL